MKRFLTLALGFTLAVLATACYKATPPGTTTTPPTPVEGNAVTMANLAFSPISLSVALGTAVTWTNKDGVAHTVISDTGVFASNDVAQGGTFSYTFNATGTYTYYCMVHPYMKGTVTVK